MSQPKGELSVLDWVLCILCWPVGCIMAIVALIQGDTKRGGMMIGVIAALFVIGFIVQLIIGLMGGGGAGVQ